jgi:hypothetical protein
MVRPGIFFVILMACIFFAQKCPADDQTQYWPLLEPPARSRQEFIPWRSLAQSLLGRIEARKLDKNVKISFLNTPYSKYVPEDLMAYTISGDGAVTIQMRDTLKEINVPPEELYWLSQFLLDHHLEDFPDTEPDVRDSAEFRVTLGIDEKRKTLRLYNSRNDNDREIVWQYMYSYGLRLLQAAGLTDQNKAIMPICKGITEIRELDTDDDGLVDWLKFRIEFISFKSGDFTLGFGGRKKALFLPQGNTVYYAYVNAYLAHCNDPAMYNYAQVSIDTKPPSSKGPYRMNLNVDTARYAARRDLRATPDISISGGESLSFEASLNQEVMLEITRAGSSDDRCVIRFVIKEVLPDRVVIGDDAESIDVTALDSFFLHDIECMGCVLTFVKSSGSIATLEAGWIGPDKAAIESKIQYFNEAFASDNYHGDKEQARASLDSALSCKEAIENMQDLRINVVYLSPAS